MQEAKRTGLFEKVRELIKTKKLLFADRSAIYRSTTKKKMLPQKINDQKLVFIAEMFPQYEKVVYAEQSMWWNYRNPKPLKKGAFTFAAGSNVPVVPCFIPTKRKPMESL